MDRLIDKKELKKLLPYSSQHVAKLERAGKFPRRVKLTRGGKAFWRLSEVQAHLSESPADQQQHISLELSSLPPTTNTLFYNHAGKGRRETARYREWRRAAGWEIQIQKVKSLLGRVTVDIGLPDRPGQAPDADNTAKALIDLLVTHRIIEADDKTILRGLSIHWETSLARVRVCIRRAGNENSLSQGDESPLRAQSFGYPRRRFCFAAIQLAPARNSAAGETWRLTQMTNTKIRMLLQDGARMQ